MSALHKITRARSALVTGNPFYGCLALYMQVIERPDIQTMATDGKSLYFNPAFVERLSEPELIGVLAHEVAHNAFMHHTRRAGRDPRQWNIAADYAINGDLIAGGFTLPKGALINARFAGMGAEAIYSALQKEASQQRPQAGQNGQAAPGQDSGQGATGQAQGAPGGNDPGGCGEIMDAAPDAGGQQEAESVWESRVRRAVNVAKAQNAGKIPGDLERLVETLNAPRVDWREVLRRFIDESAQRDFSWTRPNRRHIAAGLHLPGYVPDGLNHLVVAVDTSGSVDADTLASFAGELSAALDEGGADRVTVIYADRRVQRVDTFQAGDPLELNPVGGGGTAFADTFDYIERHAPDASAIVYFTDLQASRFGNEPAAPVIWAHWGGAGAVPPFGEVLPID